MARYVENLLDVARHGQPKFSKIWSIYIKSLDIQCWTRFQHLNERLPCLKEVMDMGHFDSLGVLFRETLGDTSGFKWKNIIIGVIKIDINVQNPYRDLKIINAR